MASDTPIRRHLKIKAEANPFDPAWELYFEKRLSYKMKSSLWGRKKLLSLWTKQAGRCPHCYQLISQETAWHVHHLLPKSKGGDDRASNLLTSCTYSIHCIIRVNSWLLKLFQYLTKVEKDDT